MNNGKARRGANLEQPEDIVDSPDAWRGPMKIKDESAGVPDVRDRAHAEAMAVVEVLTDVDGDTFHVELSCGHKIGITRRAIYTLILRHLSVAHREIV